MASLRVEDYSELRLKEIDSITLNSQIISPLCISSSVDNKISVVSEGGIYFFELWPTPLSSHLGLNFLKSWIPGCSSPPVFDIFAPDKNIFLWNFSRKHAFETLVDTTLSYCQKQNSSMNSSYVIQCEFSPLINGRSYASCLTNHGQLEIYKYQLNKWFPILNVTNLWKSHCSVDENLQESDYNYFKSKISEIKIIGMKWCEKPEVFFITSHENGSIVMWNVNSNLSILKMSVMHCFQIYEKSSCMEIVYLKNPENLILIIGTSTGIVKSLLINLNTGQIVKVNDLWNHKDLISPNFIKALCTNEKIIIFTVKRHVLLIHSTKKQSLSDGETMNISWRHFSSVIVGLSDYYDNLIICLQNHDIYRVNISNCETIDFEIVDLGIKLKHKTSYQCCGLTMSTNKAIWITISTPKINYDSLPKISHLSIYSLETKKFNSITASTSTMLIERIIKELPNTRLCDIFDYLELMRMEFLVEGSKFNKFYEFNKDSSLLKLQLILWEAKLKFFCNSDDNKLFIKELEILIAQKRAAKVVSDLENLKTLTYQQKRSMKICKALLNQTKKSHFIESELCTICDSNCICEDVRSSSCENGHAFPRCCLSLLPCDVVPYAICRICDSVALLSFVTEKNNHCPYCDSLLEEDQRVRKNCRSTG